MTVCVICGTSSAIAAHGRSNRMCDGPLPLEASGEFPCIVPRFLSHSARRRGRREVREERHAAQVRRGGACHARRTLSGFALVLAVCCCLLYTSPSPRDS